MIIKWASAFRGLQKNKSEFNCFVKHEGIPYMENLQHNFKWVTFIEMHIEISAPRFSLLYILILIFVKYG